MELTRMTQQQLGQLFNVSTRRIRQMAADEGMPRNADGTYSGPACVAWRCAQAAATARSEDAVPSEALEEKRKREVVLLDMQIGERRKELVSRAEVQEAVALAHSGIRGLISRWERKHRDSEARELRGAIDIGLRALDAKLEGGDTHV